MDGPQLLPAASKTCVKIHDDAKFKRRVIKEGLRPYLFDNVSAWEMQG